MSTSGTARDAWQRTIRPPARRWRRAAAWLLAPLAAGLLWSASQRVQLPPADGRAILGRATGNASADGRLRIGTFNIHGGKGRDGVRDLARTARCLATLDLVGLNEVHGAWFWQQSDQAELLGRRLGLKWLFAPTEERWCHYQFGNGLLTNLDVAHWQRIPLARQRGRSFRNLLLSGVEYRGTRILVVVTHIDRSDDAERRRQLRVAGDFFLSLAEPAILMGDMNTSADEEGIQRILRAPGVRDPLSDVMGDKAPRRIDWILTRGLRTLDAGIVDSGASDHPHIWAELEPAAAGAALAQPR